MEFGQEVAPKFASAFAERVRGYEAGTRVFLQGLGMYAEKLGRFNRVYETLWVEKRLRGRRMHC